MTSDEPAAGTAPPRPLTRDPSFLRLWMTGSTLMAMRWFEMLATGVFTYQVTQSALMVALVTLSRAMPNLLFGAITGAIADRYDRRALLLIGMSLLFASAAVLCGLALLGVLAPWHIMAGAFVGGIVFSTEFPVRRTMMGDIAGVDRIGRAMGLDLTANNATRIIGPAMGGLVLETIGIAGIFAVSTAAYALCIFLISGVARPARAAAAATSFFAHLVEGLRYVRGERALVGTMVITIIMNIWILPYVTMVPVVGRDDLDLSAFPIGLLLSSEGVGALLGSLAIATYAQPRFFSKLYLYGSILMGFAVLCFAWSDVYTISIVATFVAGLGIAGFTTMQATLPYALATPEMRARVMGVLSVCIGTGPIGLLHLGLLADWLGAQGALAVIGAEGLIALGLTMWKWPEVR